MAGRVALNAFALALAIFLVLPILAIVPAAFSDQSFIRLPPESWSMRWWGDFFADVSWRRSLLTSLQVAVCAALLSIVLGTSAAMAIARLRGRLRALVMALFIGPVIVPVIVLAVALYSVGRMTGLVGTVTGLVIGHAMLSLPYVVLNVGVSLRGLDPRLPMAAAGLGAGPFRVFRTVTLPAIMPGVLGGAVFAFVTSFDEVVLSIFLTGPTTTTLPVRIWEAIRIEFTPVLAVAGTVMIGLALLGAAATQLVRRG